MAVFDKASLVMIPSQYKEGKIYNIKPEDQSSSFEFERGSAATRVNSSGLIEYVGVGAELITDGGFDDASAWGTSGGASVSGGVGVFPIAFSQINQSGIEFINGETYLITFEITSSNSNISWFTQTTSIKGYANYAQGTHTLIYNSSADTSGLIIYSSGVASTIDNVSIKDISNDTPRLDYSGTEPALLLEPQRSNKVIESQNFTSTHWDTVNTSFTNNQGTSPDGQNNATKLVATADSNQHWFERNVYNDATTGADYVYSAFFKSDGSDFVQIATSTGFQNKYQNFNLSNGTLSNGDLDSAGYSASIEPYRDGWYRCIVKATTRTDSLGVNARFITVPILTNVGRNVIFTGDGVNGVLTYGHQLEQGSYPTSYIPTNGQTETRLADVCGTGGYDSVFNNSQGTLYMEFKSPTEGNSSAWINLSSGTDTDDWLFFGKDQDKLRVYLKQNNVVETSDTSTNLPTDFAKVAVTYNTNSFKLNVNGVEVFDKNISPNFANNLDTLSFGSTTSTPLPEKIEVKALHYFPEALTDTELQQLTTI